MFFRIDIFFPFWFALNSVLIYLITITLLVQRGDFKKYFDNTLNDWFIRSWFLIVEPDVKYFSKHQQLFNLIPITFKNDFMVPKIAPPGKGRAVFKVLQTFHFFSIMHLLFSPYYRYLWYTSDSWIICLRFKYRKQTRWNTVLHGQHFYTWHFTCCHQYALSFTWNKYNVVQQNTSRC